MEVQVSVMFDSPMGNLDPSATHRVSTIGPMRAPRQNHRSPVSLRGYPELETGASVPNRRRRRCPKPRAAHSRNHGSSRSGSC
jgi:hypothetical protein